MLRKSKTLAKIRAGEPVRMCSLGHFNPAYVRLAAHVGFDCIWLDAEHRSFSALQLQALFSYFHQFDIDCMLRPPTTEKTRLYRYLEDGATGLMIPHVSTPENAIQLVEATKFPPLGDRGLDGVGMDAGFMWSSDFVEHANRETFLVVQIETPQAVENVEAIAAIEGVEGMFIGPADLGLRIEQTHTKLKLHEAIARVAEAARVNGKAWGLPVASIESLRQYRGQGAQLLAYGNDYFAMRDMLQARAAELDEVYHR